MDLNLNFKTKNVISRVLGVKVCERQVLSFNIDFANWARLLHVVAVVLPTWC